MSKWGKRFWKIARRMYLKYFWQMETSRINQQNFFLSHQKSIKRMFNQNNSDKSQFRKTKLTLIRGTAW